MKKIPDWVVVFVILISFIITILSIGTRSGVTTQQVRETLPGDSIIPQPWISIDRAAALPAPASVAWPWVAQLGSERGGWYAPLWLENTLHEYAASTTLSQFQNLTVGEVVPDFGGGALKVLAVEPGRYVVYGSVHGPATSTAAAEQTDYPFTWALVLENDTPTSTSFHLRLRLARPTHGAGQYISPALPGFFDYVTDVVMFNGLQQRLRGM